MHVGSDRQDINLSSLLLFLKVWWISDIQSLDVLEPASLVRLGGQGVAGLKVIIVWIIGACHERAHSVSTLSVLRGVHLLGLRVKRCITDVIWENGIRVLGAFQSSSSEIEIHLGWHLVIYVVHPSMPVVMCVSCQLKTIHLI